jgi:hypothetical protein
MAGEISMGRSSVALLALGLVALGSGCGAGASEGGGTTTCSGGIACTPSSTPLPCKTYRTACASSTGQSACEAVSNLADGTPCGANVYCASGMCTPVSVPTNVPLMRAMHMGGNWGGNIDGMKNLPDAYIQSLLADNIDWIGIYLPIFNTSISDPTVRIRYRPATDTNYANMYSFDDAELAAAVTRFKQNGIHVYWSLTFIQPEPGDHSGTCNTSQYAVDHHLFGDPTTPLPGASAWEGNCVNPAYWWWSPAHPDHAANVARFWSTYTDVAVKYARMAQQLGVEMFSLGAESDRLFRTRPSARFPSDFRSELSRLVAAVRAEYQGLVTYSQQSFVHLPHPEWWGLDTPATEYLFSDLGLDVIGISGYYSLTTAPVNRVWSVNEFETGWASVFDQYLVPLQARNPHTAIVFTDTGSADVINAPFSPLMGSGDPFVFMDVNGDGIDDGREQQQNFYQGLLNANASRGYLLRGLFFAWKDIEPDQYVAAWNDTHRSISINRKPAEETVKRVYGAWKSLRLADR